MEDDSVDSVVTDPPYGLSKEPDINEVLSKWLAGEDYDHGHGGFMGKAWDSFVPHPDIWTEVHRVLKPGGHALVFAGTRTQDLMTISLRLAGFEVRDVIEWLYFSGFPKSHDVSKAFDRRAGAEREVVGVRNDGIGSDSGEGRYNWNNGKSTASSTIDITAPATDLAKHWDGWGTALKPAHEPIIVVRKPLIDADTGRKLTVANCVEKYGTGAINIDASRIGDGEDRASGGLAKAEHYIDRHTVTPTDKSQVTRPTGGRFPANCITLDSDEFYSKYFNVSPAELSKKASKKDRNSDWQGEEIALEEKESRKSGSRPQLEGSCPEHGQGLRSGESVYPCGCPLSYRESEQVTYLKNSHPTVKPTDLMAWLVRLVTPEGGTVLDPFAGSGSTLVAAKREGFGFIGVELTEEYIPIIEARTGVEHTKAETDEGQAKE